MSQLVHPPHTLVVTVQPDSAEAVFEMTAAEVAARKSTRMWMHMIQTGWDRRRLKRIMRLVRDGR